MILNEILALPDEAYVSEADLSVALDKTIPTLRTWGSRRNGPPRTVAGRKVLYRVGGLRQWLRAREKDFDQARRGQRRRRVAA